MVTEIDYLTELPAKDRALLLRIHGERFDRSVVANRTEDIASCVLFELPQEEEELKNFLYPQSANGVLKTNFTAQLLNNSAIMLTFKMLRGIVNASDLLAITSPIAVNVSIHRSCLQHRLSIPYVELTFLPIPPKRRKNVVPESVIDTAQTTRTVTEIISASSGSPLIASQMARSSILMTLAECTPEFNTSLGRMQNPFQASIGPTPYGEFIASSVLNHVLIFGVAFVHALSGAVYAKLKHISFVEGLTFVRFPSITILPILYLVEPTCMSAMVTIIYGETPLWKAMGVFSLLLSLAIVCSTFMYLRRTWHADMIPGESPFKMRRKRRELINDDDDVETAKEAMWRLRLRQCYTLIGYFIDGGVAWKDHPGHKGYCRRNRLLFMDFTGKWYWFMTAEIAMAAFIGILDGVKLGYGQCNAVVIALIIALFIFLVAIIALRPYNAPFLLFFSICVTILQLFGAICMAVAMFSGDDSWQEMAEMTSVIGIYIILGRAIFDITPKIKQFISMIIKSFCRKKKGPTSGHVDLTERLLEVVHQDGDDDIKVEDHDAAAEQERVNANNSFAIEEELPEVDTSEWPEYDWDENNFVNPLPREVDNEVYIGVSGLGEHEIIKKLNARKELVEKENLETIRQRQAAARKAELDAILDGLDNPSESKDPESLTEPPPRRVSNVFATQLGGPKIGAATLAKTLTPHAVASAARSAEVSPMMLGLQPQLSGGGYSSTEFEMTRSACSTLTPQHSLVVPGSSSPSPNSKRHLTHDAELDAFLDELEAQETRPEFDPDAEEEEDEQREEASDDRDQDDEGEESTSAARGHSIDDLDALLEGAATRTVSKEEVDNDDAEALFREYSEGLLETDVGEVADEPFAEPAVILLPKAATLLKHQKTSSSSSNSGPTVDRRSSDSALNETVPNDAKAHKFQSQKEPIAADLAGFSAEELSVL